MKWISKSGNKFFINRGPSHPIAPGLHRMHRLVSTFALELAHPKRPFGRGTGESRDQVLSLMPIYSEKAGKFEQIARARVKDSDGGMNALSTGLF